MKRLTAISVITLAVLTSLPVSAEVDFLKSVEILKAGSGDAKQDCAVYQTLGKSIDGLEYVEELAREEMFKAGYERKSKGIKLSAKQVNQTSEVKEYAKASLAVWREKRKQSAVKFAIAAHLGYSLKARQIMWEWSPGVGSLWLANAKKLRKDQLPFLESYDRGLPHLKVFRFCKTLFKD